VAADNLSRSLTAGGHQREFMPIDGDHSRSLRSLELFLIASVTTAQEFIDSAVGFLFQ
jgi:hypothetical protein